MTRPRTAEGYGDSMGEVGSTGAATPPLRASDAEREQVAEALRAHCSLGRLTVDELDERLTAAYAARTRNELAALMHDLPGSASAAAPPTPPLRRGPLPLMPGLAPFSERVLVDRPVGETMAAALEEIAPWLHGFGYRLVRRSDTELEFSSRRHPVWTFVVAVLLFPFGLVALLHTAGSELVLRVSESGSEATTITVYGAAPLPVRRTFARLATGRTRLPEGRR
jgi:hypothetical protein